MISALCFGLIVNVWFNVNTRIDVRPQFIDEELRRVTNVKRLKLHNRFIEKLFNKYRVNEFLVKFYDSEDTTWDERIEFNNFIDVFGRGIWGQSQSTADNFAKGYMKEFRKAGHLKDRCWIGEYGNNTLVYLYGRDIHEFDLVYLMRKRDEKDI